MRSLVITSLLVSALAACERATPPARTTPVPAVEAEPAAAGPREWDPWKDAAARGIEFRAVGQEPGWFLEIDNERWMRLLYAYAERTATTPVPSPVEQGKATILESSADGHRLRVEISGEACADAMSGQPFPATVTVTIDGSRLQGCGRWLP